jgi:uncharacterized protein YkwD
MSRHVGRVLALVGSTCALAALGASTASAEKEGGSAGLPGELSPCLLWGDVVPVELGRESARQAVMCLVNEERAAAGLPPLASNRRLQQASQRHTAAMDGTGCFTHRCPGEPGLKRRIARYLKGHPRRWKYGEVIAWAPAPLASPRQTVDALMNSALHRSHILHRKYEDAGVGFTVGTPTSAFDLGGIYTIDFGMRDG